MSIFAILDNTFSVALILTFWSLSHQHAVAGSRLGRAIAIGCGILGMTTFGAMIFRNDAALSHLVAPTVLTSKGVLFLTLALLAVSCANLPNRKR